jgi:LPXTG-motif cell wall-anchored protein
MMNWQILLNNKVIIKMKKAILIFSLIGVFLMVNSSLAVSQEKPKPKKDTVNIDTDAKPKFYYAVEDEKPKAPVAEKSGTATIIMIVGGVAIVGGTIYLMMKKKKK